MVDLHRQTILDRAKLAMGSIGERFTAWRYGRIDSKAPLGKRGEQAAAMLLRRKGMKIVASNYRDRCGEIDIIAVDKRPDGLLSVVFVEVKTLASKLPGHPADRVDGAKQQRLTRLALQFLKRRKLLQHPARFDVVAVWWPDASAPLPDRMEHYVDAFPATDFESFFS